jgi:NAD(P)H-nitrite reductase large subunit
MVVRKHTNSRTKYLIVGNSAGAIGAVEAIRGIDSSGAITVISEEPYHAYSRPLISKLLTKERTIDEILFREQDFYHNHKIELLTGKKVIKLALQEHVVELENGSSIYWDKLLLATGGKPIIPAINEVNSKGVFTFSTIEDALNISEYMEKAKTAVVIGGGLIGISLTEALVKRGLDVNLIELKDRILNTILDETGSAMVQEALKKAGVNVVLNNTVTAVIEDS